MRRLTFVADARGARALGRALASNGALTELDLYDNLLRKIEHINTLVNLEILDLRKGLFASYIQNQQKRNKGFVDFYKGEISSIDLCELQ